MRNFWLCERREVKRFFADRMNFFLQIDDEDQIGSSVH